jgi:hypothetical protein
MPCRGYPEKLIERQSVSNIIQGWQKRFVGVMDYWADGLSISSTIPNTPLHQLSNTPVKQ